MRLLPTDRPRRSAVLASVLALSSVYFAYTYICAPRAARAENLRLRLADLQASVRRTGSEASLDHTGLQRRLEVYEAHLAQLEDLIPSSEGVASLLEAVSVEERLAGVEVTMLRPETPKAGELYDRWSYELAVQGDYHAIGSFLTSVASLERIMAPDDLAVERAPPSGTMLPGSANQAEARFRLRTCVVSPMQHDDTSTSPASEVSAQISEDLSFRRERFTYMTVGRRDPMMPPGASVTGNPMVGGVRLLGIIHHPRARLSLVLLEVGLKSEEDGGGAPTREPLPMGVRLRIGDSVGGTRIAEIHPDHVVVETGSPEGVHRHVLEMSRGERGRGK